MAAAFEWIGRRNEILSLFFDPDYRALCEWFNEQRCVQQMQQSMCASVRGPSLSESVMWWKERSNDPPVQVLWKECEGAAESLAQREVVVNVAAADGGAQLCVGAALIGGDDKDITALSNALLERGLTSAVVFASGVRRDHGRAALHPNAEASYRAQTGVDPLAHDAFTALRAIVGMQAPARGPGGVEHGVESALAGHTHEFVPQSGGGESAAAPPDESDAMLEACTRGYVTVESVWGCLPRLVSLPRCVEDAEEYCSIVSHVEVRVPLFGWSEPGIAIQCPASPTGGDEGTGRTPSTLVQVFVAPHANFAETEQSAQYHASLGIPLVPVVLVGEHCLEEDAIKVVADVCALELHECVFVVHARGDDAAMLAVGGNTQVEFGWEALRGHLVGLINKQRCVH